MVITSRGCCCLAVIVFTRQNCRGGKTLYVGLVAARIFLEFRKYSRTLMLNISVEKKQSDRTGFNCMWFMTCGVGQRKACSCHNYMLHLCRAMKNTKLSCCHNVIRN